MKEQERTLMTGLVLLLVVLALGFSVHRDPRFAGSLAGGLLGVSAAALLLIPLAYLLVKRVPFLKRRVTRAVSLRTLLAVHIYAGVLGPILGVLHSGHRFASALGISLTAMMIVVVLSGFVGRYLVSRTAADLREQKDLLAGLRAAHARTAAELVREPRSAGALRPFSGFWSRLAAPFFLPEARSSAAPLPAAARALRLSESIADLEYAIKTREVLKQVFGRWLACHILISVVLYLLLGLHVWAAWHFGIRWLA